MVQEEEFTPTEKQEATMRGLCRELGLSFQQEVKQLSSQEAYSNKIGELLKQKKEKKAHDQAVSQCSSLEDVHCCTVVCRPGCRLPACVMICLVASCSTGTTFDTPTAVNAHCVSQWPVVHAEATMFYNQLVVC